MSMERLKELREYKGITQEQLAERLGVAKSTIGMWENAKREPDLAMLSEIADFFDVSVDYLIGRRKPDKSSETQKATGEKLLKEIVEQIAKEIAEDMAEPILRFTANCAEVMKAEGMSEQEIACHLILLKKQIHSYFARYDNW
jgi:transcriptional regulator with XRE-family HTH domain